MKYNLIETSEPIKTILDLNGITVDDLKIDNLNFEVNDQTFIKFKEIFDQNLNKKYLIVGDFDADGICATTIIRKLFSYLNIDANYYIPSRLKEGYGLNKDIVNKAIDNKFDGLFLVDNGIVCNDLIDYAKENGLMVFIIDHHEYSKLPNADAIIHSNIVNDKFKGLSAGGLSYIFSSLYYKDDYSLVLGGISTISDVMSVKGFNRLLITKTMELLMTNKFYQLNFLNDNLSFTYSNLSFNVIPKINAISRMEPMGNPNYLVKYLLSDEMYCNKYIKEINSINDERKKLSKNLSNKADSLIKGDEDIIVLAGPDFNKGLCGIIANKILFKYKKPTIIFEYNDHLYTGSGRSVGDINLYETLKPFEHYDSYGGHEKAVGLTIKEEYFEKFIKFVNEIDYKHEYIEDIILVDDSLLDMGLFKDIEELSPTGPDLKIPLFAIKNKDFKKITVSSRFPKYHINDNLSAISFNEEFLNVYPNYLIGKLSIDKYNDGSLSLIIEDLI